MSELMNCDYETAWEKYTHEIIKMCVTREDISPLLNQDFIQENGGCMDIFARDLQIGDKVNCHEQGWLEVKKIEDKWVIYVTYDNGTETYYSRDRRLFVVR